MLELQDIHTYYDHIHALKGVSMTVNEGEIVALIGGNGAGKTTTLRTISGMMKPRSGSLTFEGQNIAGIPAHHILNRGISHVPEGRRIFKDMTVRENLDVGAYSVTDRALIESRIQEGFGFFPRLKEREGQLGGTMSGGEQQMLAISRSLMSRPKLLLLDEPSLGLAPRIVAQIFDFIGQLKNEGLTLLVVEQNATQALRFADRVYVVSSGSLRYDGPPAKLADEHGLLNLYLGG